MAYAALVGAILSVASSQQQGREVKADRKYQADQREADAAAAAADAAADAKEREGMARLHANNIRRSADAQRSATRASMAASGIQVTGEGTPILIDQKIGEDAEHDAFMTLISSKNSSISSKNSSSIASERAGAEAYGLRQQGSRAQKSANVSSVGSLLSAGSSYSSAKGGWKGAGR